MNFSGIIIDYGFYTLPYLESAKKINLKTEEKNQINDIIFRKLNVKNIHEANDIPDFRHVYGKTFVNIALNRFFKNTLKNEFLVKVINGVRFLVYDNQKIMINYFPIGNLPKIDINHKLHLVVGYNLEKNTIYVFGELKIVLKNKRELADFIEKNTINGGESFISFQIIKPYYYV